MIKYLKCTDTDIRIKDRTNSIMLKIKLSLFFLFLKTNQNATFISLYGAMSRVKTPHRLLE